MSTASEPHEVMVRVGRGRALVEQGDPAALRKMLTDAWDSIGGERGDPLHRCAIAHALADVQDDARTELAWDLRALDAADALSDERLAQAGVIGRVAGFYPSLHLNLGDSHRRLGDLDRSREHLQRGRDFLRALDDDGDARMVRGGFERLEERLVTAR